MKEVKVTRTIEEIVGWEAEDGTRFTTQDQCREYEKTAKAVIKSRFYSLFTKRKSVDYWTHVPFISCGCDWSAGLIHLNTAADVTTANMYVQLIGGSKWFTDDMIGKDIVVGLDDCDDWVVIYGTIDECVACYKDALMELTKADEKEN